MTRRVPPGFKPGQSGNPKGRPKGTSEAAKLRAAIAGDIPDIVKALVNKAKDGDTQAAGLLLSRICPPLKAETIAAPVAGLGNGTLAERANAVLDAAAKGELGPDVAASLVAAVGAVARVIEVDDIERRIAALESGHEEGH